MSNPTQPVSVTDVFVLSAQVAELVGDLTPGPQTTSADLDNARLAAAEAVVSGLQQHISAPAPSPAPPPTDTDTTQTITSIVEAVIQRHVVPHVVARRSSATVVSPSLIAAPEATAGRALLASHGPFIDMFGRPVWIDVFGVASFVGIQRSGQPHPFLYIEVPVSAGTATAVKLGRGSVWIATGGLAAGAPPSSLVGLRIKRGTLQLGSGAQGTTPTVVVPATAVVTLDIELDPASAPTGSGPGADARNATVVVPKTATFTFSPSGIRLEKAGNAQLQALGVNLALTYEQSHAVYEPAVRRITLPMATNTTSIDVTDSRSTLVTVAGAAPVIRAGWSVPVTVAAAATLGPAAGAGGVAAALDAGLSLSLPGRPGVAAGPTILFAEPATLGLAGIAAESPGPAQTVTLWEASPTQQGRLSFRFPKPFPYGWVSQAAAGAEDLAFIAPLSANLDRPLTVNDERVPFATDAGLIGYLQTTSETLFVAFGQASGPQTLTSQSFAIKNLLLKTSNPLVLVAAGTLTDTGVAPGALALGLDLRYLLPTLPDPYATNLAFNPRALLQPTQIGLLTMLLRWQPNAEPTVDLLLPNTTNQTLTSALPPPIRGVPTDAAVADTVAVPAVAQRFPVAAAITDAGVSLLDVSTNVSLFGVGFQPGSGTDTPTSTGAGAAAPVAVSDLFLEGPGSGVRVFTLPAVQWEPVFTPDQTQPFDSPLTFPDCGGATVLGSDSVALVPIAPRPAIDALVAAYHSGSPPTKVAARFTLPFGIVAFAEIRRATTLSGLSPFFGEVTPTFTSADLTGGDQLSIRAAVERFFLFGAGGESPSLPGTAVQVHNAMLNGVPVNDTVISPITDTFNSNFSTTAANPRVPVTRIDISGFGESLFSDWSNPSDEAAIISKARFDVLVGRTSLEVVQAYSVLYPYAVRVVRTITIQRLNTGTVVRHDSGWQAVSDGVYKYPDPALITHPGVVARATRVTNIRDTGQTYTTTDSTHAELMAVRFDCTVGIESVVAGGDATGVAAQDQLGYVQLTPGLGFNNVLSADQYQELLGAVGQLGGAVDCTIDIAGSGQRMRIARVGIDATPGMGGPEFAMAAWGSPLFPGGGQWSVLRQTSPANAPQPLVSDRAVPLIRAGAAGTPPPSTSPYRFADPADTLLPDNPAADYGIVHATGTQRTFFPRPKIEAGSQQITSTQIPLIADPVILATAVGLFPKPAGCIPFPDNAYALAIGAGGNFTLKRATASFTTPPLKRVIRESQAARSVAYCADENNTPSVVTLAIDTAAPRPWSLTITNMSMASESGSLGEVQRIVGTVSSSATAPTKFTDSRFVFGPPLQPVAQVVSFLEHFGPLPPLDVSMTNQWQLQVGLKADFEKILEQYPGLKDFLKKFIEDLDVLMAWVETPTSQNSTTTFEVTVKIPTPFEPVVAIGLAKVKLQVGDDGNAQTFELGVGVGVDFDLVKDVVGVVAYFAETAFLITGDNVFAVGVGVLVKGEVDLAVVSVGISVEAKMALLKVTCGSDTTIWGVAQLTFALEVTIAFVIDIEFDIQAEEDQNIDGGPCPLPNVV
jgi:hypothetical protein